MKNKLTFSIDKVELIEKISNSQFARVRIQAFASGENHHDMPVTVEALKNAESTIYDKPIVWKYDELTDDAETHNKLEIPAGFVPRHSANISYEEVEDGRVFFCVDALIWVFYSGKLLDIFERDGDKSVSVEILPLEIVRNNENKLEIVNFCYGAITVLGEAYDPAIDDAKAQLIQFSKDRKTVEEILESKEKNKEGEIMAFNKIEFAKTIGMTANQMMEKMSIGCADKYYVRDFGEGYVFCYSYEDSMVYAVPYSIDNKNINMDFEKKSLARMAYVVDDEDCDDLMGFVAKETEKKIESQKEEFAAEKENLENENKEFAKKSEEFETEKANFSKEIQDLKDENSKLKEFKSNVEASEKQTKIEFAIKEVSDVLTTEQCEEWKNKAIEFENIDSFTNAIKAFAFTITKGQVSKDDIVKFSLPNNVIDNKNNENQSIWDRLNN